MKAKANENPSDANILVPGKSIGQVRLFSSIGEYAPRDYERVESVFDNDSGYWYDFMDGDIHAWHDMAVDGGDVDEKIITDVTCDSNCCWEGENLIGMSYPYFLRRFNLVADCEDMEYIYTSEKHTQRIYYFYALGLYVWTWRKHIIEVGIADLSDMNDE